MSKQQMVESIIFYKKSKWSYEQTLRQVKRQYSSKSKPWSIAKTKFVKQIWKEGAPMASDDKIKEMLVFSAPFAKELKLKKSKSKRVWDVTPPTLRWVSTRKTYATKEALEKEIEKIEKQMSSFKKFRVAGDVGSWTHMYKHKKSLPKTTLFLFIEEETKRKPYSIRITLDHTA